MVAKAKHSANPSKSRRRFLAGFAGGAAIAASGSLVYATTVEPVWLRVARYRVTVPRLPAALDGVRIAQLSDTHLGPFVPLARIASAVALCNRLRPDLVLLSIGGVGDLWEDAVDFERALGGCPTGTPRLLLSHNPDVAEQLPAGADVDLMLSGHTHGGQVRLPLFGSPFVPSRFGDKYAGGLVRGPRCRVLVSRGVGATVLPMRFGVRPEIVLLTLHRRHDHDG